MVVRRTLLKAGFGAGLGWTLTPEWATAQEAPAGGPQIGDFLVRVGDANKYPLSPGEIKRGAKPVIAWAMDPMNETLRDGSKLHQVLLVRFDPQTSPPIPDHARPMAWSHTAPRARIWTASWTIFSRTSRCCTAPATNRNSIPKTTPRSLAAYRRGRWRDCHSSSMMDSSWSRVRSPGASVFSSA